MDNLPEKRKPKLMQTILEGASKVDIVRQYGNLTIGDVAGQGYPALSGLAKEHGPEKVERSLAILLVEASSYFSETLDKETALELAVDVRKDNYWLSLEDCYIVTQRLKKSKLYGKLTPNRILNEFETYREERMQHSIKKRENEHLQNFTRRQRDPNESREAVRIDEQFAQFKEQYQKSRNGEDTAS
jgi:hypothetical protein